MPPCNMTLTLGRFLEEDPILMAMHTHEKRWADLLSNDPLSDDLHGWKENVITLCAPALKEVVAFHEVTTSKKVTFADLYPSHASPMLTQLVAAARVCTPSPLFTEPFVTAVPTPTAAAPAPTAAAPAPLFMEPPKAPVEPPRPFFASAATIVPVEQPFVLPAPPGVKTIIAKNLPRDITPHDLRERFQLYGDVWDVYLPRNKDPKSPQHGTIRGFALIKYRSENDSARAVRVLSMLGLSIRGKQVTVEFAKSDTAAR